MRQLLGICAVTVLLSAAGGAAFADVITLDNGRSVRGRIVRREGGRVVIELDNGGRITIPESKVVQVRPDPDSAAGQAQTVPTGVRPPPTGADARPEAQGVPAGPTVPDKPAAAAEPDPKQQARVAELVRALGDKDDDGGSEAAGAARAELARIGEPAVEALCKALEDQVWTRRFNAAKALGEVGSKRSVRALLAALHTGTPAQGQKPAWWDRSFLRGCADSLRRITGAGFSYDSDSVLAGAEVQKMLAWWTENAKDYPDQVGAPPAKAGTPEPGDAQRPDPAEEIRKLSPRKFPAPASTVRGE